MIKLFDSHTHLDLTVKKMRNADETFHSIIERASKQHVQIAIQVGIDFESSSRALDMASQLKDQVFATIGYHPSNPFSKTDIDRLEKLAIKHQDNKSFVAIGEVGLDYHWVTDSESRLLQRQSFDFWLALANRLHKSVTIHCRPGKKDDPEDALADCLKILQSNNMQVPVIMHCFAGDTNYAQSFQEIGCYLSFAGNVTYPNAHDLQQSLKTTREDRLLIETDAPFLAPNPNRGKINEPQYLIDTLSFVAKLRKQDKQKLAARIFENSLTAFGLQDYPSLR